MSGELLADLAADLVLGELGDVRLRLRFVDHVNAGRLARDHRGARCLGERG